MIRVVFIATMTLAAVVAVQPAFAISGINGTSLNGTSLNGTASANVSAGAVDDVSAVILPTGEKISR